MESPQMGGTSFSLESLMTPNFVFFVVTLAVIGYLYQTRMVLGRESEVKAQSTNLFEKQMYLEIGFMVLLGFCIYIFNNNDNTTEQDISNNVTANVDAITDENNGTAAAATTTTTTTTTNGKRKLIVVLNQKKNQ